MKAFDRFDKIVNRISDVLMKGSAATMFFIAAVSFADMIGRYIFLKALTGAQDLVEVAMCVFVYAGLGMAIRQRKIIMVPVIIDLMKKRGREFTVAIGNLICFVMAIVIISQLYESTLSKFEKLLVGTAVLKIPNAPFYMFATFGFIIIALELLILVIKDFRGSKEETQIEETVDHSDIVEGRWD